MINQNTIINKPIFLLSILIMILGSSIASANGDTGKYETPQQMVQQVIDTAFTRIKKEQGAIEAQPTHMQSIVAQELMPNVDHIYSALYVLGSHAAKTEKSLLTEYIEVFKGYLVKSYAVALKSYRDQEVVVLPASTAEDKSSASIKALLKEKGKPDVQLVFKVRKDKSGQWKAYDIVVEGVSLLQSKRAEFADVLRKEGVLKLMQLLEQKVARAENS